MNFYPAYLLMVLLLGAAGFTGDDLRSVENLPASSHGEAVFCVLNSEIGRMMVR
jgi:hypothetical protein